jgi:alpha-beta hydrolase superfamily lysophospholipase
MHFEIPSDEGLPIRGDIHAPQDPRALVVIVHGFKGFKDWGFFPWLAEWLCDERLVAVRFNLSRSGIGETADSFDRLDLFRDDTYSIQIADVLNVARHVQAKFRELPLFLLGHSRGGGVALLAATKLRNLTGVVTWSSIARADRWDAETKKTWRAGGSLEVVNQRTKQVMPMSTAILDDYESHKRRLDILAAAAKLQVPLLAIHGAGDESVPMEESKQIAAAARDASLLIIERASHTYNSIHPLVNIPTALTIAATVSAHFCIAYS